MRLQKRITFALAVFVLLSASGCREKRIGATYDPFAIFPATAQWAWEEELNRLPTDPSMAELNIRVLVEEAITKGLAKRGYEMAPEGGEVQFLIHYQVGIAKRIEPNSVQGFGSLSLTLVDPTTNRDVWVGFVKTRADITLSESARRKRLQQQVDTMLKKFPPSQS
jgi:hypothetical protein